MNNLLSLVALGLACLAAPAPLWADEPPVASAKAVADLGTELGVVIQLKGGVGRIVALPASTLSPEGRIAALAEDLTGSWKRILRVVEKPAARASASTELERRVTLGFRDLPTDKAFAIVARQMRAEWEPDTALGRRVTLPGASRSVRELLDEIGRQSGVSWTLEYRIDAPDAEAIRALSQPEPPSPMQQMPVVEPTPDITIRVFPTVPPATAWSKGLKESVMKLIKAPPDRRDAALDAFLKEIGEAAVLFQAVAIERRPAYRSAGSRLYEQWARLYRGLAPTVRDELDPADAVMRDLLRN